MTPEQALIGTWKLVSFEINYADGTADQPYGPHPFGFAHYAPDGLMLIHLSNPDQQWQAAPATPGGRSLPGFISYAARYRLDGDHVVHEVTVSPVIHIPAGTVLARRADLDGDRLTLTVPDALASKPGSARLVWQRTPATGRAGAV